MLFFKIMPAHSIFRILLIIVVTKSAVAISFQELRRIEEPPYDYSDAGVTPAEYTNAVDTNMEKLTWNLQQILNELNDRMRQYPPIKKRNDLLCRMSVGGAGAGACDTKNHQNIGYLKSASSPGRRKRRDLRLFRI